MATSVDFIAYRKTLALPLPQPPLPPLLLRYLFLHICTSAGKLASMKEISNVCKQTLYLISMSVY